MRTLRLPSPFDDPRRGSAVATPTCCSSCCCCCLVTTLTSTTMAAVYVNQRASGRDVGLLARIGLSVAGVAGLLLATAGLFGAAIGGPTIEVRLGGLSAFMSGLVLLVIARSGGGGARFGDLGWAGAVTAATATAFVAEVVSFGFLLWGQLLAIPVPIVAGVLLHRRMGGRR